MILQIINKQKIKLIVSLLPDIELNKLGFDDFIWSKEEIEYIKFPIDDFGVPSNNKFDELKELISTIKENLMLSNPVLNSLQWWKRTIWDDSALVLKAMKEKDTIKKVRENVVGAIETEEQETFVERLDLKVIHEITNWTHN